MSEKKIFEIIEENCDSSISYKNTDIPIISAKKFQEMYRNQEDAYVIRGILADSTEEKKITGTLSHSGHVLTVLNPSSRPGGLKKLKGYICVGEDNFIEVYATNIIPFIIILAVLVVAAILIFAIPWKKKAAPEQKEKLALDSSQQDFVEQKDETPKVRNIIMPGWVTITIPANTTSIGRGIDLYNPDKNVWNACPDCGQELDENNKCSHCDKKIAAGDVVEDCFYMTFALCLSEGDEVLYQSDLVSPGKHLQNITLTRALDPGTYDAYIFIQPYKSDMATPCNNGVVKIDLIAE